MPKWGEYSTADLLKDYQSRQSDQEMMDQYGKTAMQSPITIDPQVEDSEMRTQQVQAEDPRWEDASTSWFQTGMLDPDLERDLNSPAVSGDFLRELATRYSGSRPQNLEEYIKLGNDMVQSQRYPADYVKRRMLEMMPPSIRKDYEVKMQKAEAKRQYMDELEKQAWQRDYLSKNMPSGFTLAPDGTIVNEYKADEMRKKLRQDARGKLAGFYKQRDAVLAKKGGDTTFIDALIAEQEADYAELGGSAVQPGSGVTAPSASAAIAKWSSIGAR